MKNVILSILITILSYNAFSQERDINTTFVSHGYLYDTLDTIFDKPTDYITQFNEHDNCTIINYAGEHIYKIKYKQWVGYVKDKFLNVNEDMKSLLANSKQDTKELNKNKLELETLRQENLKHDSITKALEVKKAAQKTKDSIAKVKEDKLKLEILRRENLKHDSITKVLEIKKAVQKTKDSITKAKEDKLKIETLNRENLKHDSITKALEIKKAAQKTEDSIAKVKEDKLKLEILRRENLKHDSITKVLEIKKAVQKTKDSIAKAKEDKLKIEILNRENLKHDAIVKVHQLKQKDNILKQQNQDSITKFQELKRKEDNAHKHEIIKQDSIAKALKIEQNKITPKNQELKNNNIENTCKYQLNEIDYYSSLRIIKTNAYDVHKNLTIELYKKGKNKHVFFNLSEDLGCASYLPGNRSSVKVTLENDKTIAFYHTWNMDCGHFRFKGRLSNSQVTLLLDSPIKSIKLNGTKQSRELTTIDYNTFFIDKLKCIE